ncbi:MAG TPA: glutathione S-transferase family protein [Kofleriaceae bacterium]|nr:glutathione S-transferase family protein [Kofleriaceae bacterium]
MATPRLVTIPFSHYCEKARWGLDRAHVAYREEGHLPLFAWLPALRAGRVRTVPSLVTDGGPLTDSTDILRWCDRRGGAAPLYPDGDGAVDVTDLEDRFDVRFGPHSRRIGYGFLLPVIRDVIDDAADVPRHEVRVTRLLAPAVAAFMRRKLKVTPAGLARSRERCEEIFAEVEQRLADGRRYLCGDRFTAADLTFASLAVPLVMPPELSSYVPMDRVPPAMADDVERWRATVPGAFALRLYREERGAPGATRVR